ncbi:hypothetical protein TNCT_580741 [Trichonephila clavata]|uniref:Uncharacterized protein n=1 Tax=Trichonephila clavata TaxID=2740835 RepID=A0A8X6K125_TRICU|nr:hypothetical protein TNCT_580741 [Trichonephila clavata]
MAKPWMVNIAYLVKGTAPLMEGPIKHLREGVEVSSTGGGGWDSSLGSLSLMGIFWRKKRTWRRELAIKPWLSRSLLSMSDMESGMCRKLYWMMRRNVQRLWRVKRSAHFLKKK